MTTQFANKPLLVTANQFWQRSYAYLRTLPLDVWRNSVLFLAALWICHSLASLFWLVFPVPDIPQPPRFAAPVPQSTASASSGVKVDVAKLQEVSLFGKAGEVPVELQQTTEVPALDVDEANAATTKLNLELHGVIASSDPNEARAIIEDGNQQGLYRIGEELPRNRGVKLVKVLEERVILDNNGTPESLWLYSEEDFKKSAGNRSRHRVSPRPDEKLDTLAGPVKRSVRPDQLPKSISDVVRFSVHREDGAMVGYKVRPGRDRALFEQVGLKAGDIVTNVNGRAMTDPKELREVYQELKTATEANLGIRRGEEELQITIRVDNTGG